MVNRIIKITDSFELPAEVQEVLDAITDGKITAATAGLGGGGTSAVTSVAGKIGAVSLVKADVGLGLVDNTSDSTKFTNFRASLTKTDVGLSLVDNTSDATKLSATRAALVKGDVGLGNVDNTSDAVKHTSTVFTGTPTAPTAAVGTNTQQLATTAYVLASKTLLPLPGDGTTDVTTTIQNAINAAAAVAMNGLKFQTSGGTFQGGATAPGAGEVTLPPGMHVVSTLTLGHRVHLRGSGRGTVLIQKAATTGPVIQNRRDGTGHAQYCIISNLTVHGNKANQTAANVGILLQGDTTNDFTNVLDEDYDINCIVDNVYIMQTKGRGLSMIGAGDNFISNVKIRGADAEGCYTDQDNHLDNMDIGWSGLQGLVVAGESCMLSNIKCWRSGSVTPASGAGFYFTADCGCANALNAQDNSGPGFLWDGAFGWDASGLLADSNSRGSAGTYPAFDIFASNYNHISGVARNRFNASNNGTTNVAEQSSTVRVRSSSVGNTANLTAAVGVWGQSNTFLQSGSTTTSNTIIVNGVSQ